jgi:hypothetical protein
MYEFEVETFRVNLGTPQLYMVIVSAWFCVITKPVHIVMQSFCFEIDVLSHCHVCYWQDQIVVKVCSCFVVYFPPVILPYSTTLLSGCCA